MEGKIGEIKIFSGLYDHFECGKNIGSSRIEFWLGDKNGESLKKRFDGFTTYGYINQDIVLYRKRIYLVSYAQSFNHATDFFITKLKERGGQPVAGGGCLITSPNNLKSHKE